ncbi:MAG: hypothetical protein KKD90_01220 [Candidatus Omnitrophica bacterium]|nr:hypothetical protein [Candidatus Omnitrophota bacterium]
MTKFEILFGIKETEIKKTCVLLPLLAKDMLSNLGIKKLSRGKLYSSGQAQDLTVIVTGIGAGLAGDAVLYLEETACQDIILFGSCGLVEPKRDLGIGSLVSPLLSYSLESFSGMLLDKTKDWKAFPPDKGFMERFLNAAGENEIQKVRCATLGSLKLEEGSVDLFREKDIDVVDMECSSVFSASRHIKKKVMALFYITDIINKKPFYIKLGIEDRLRLSSSIKTAARAICKSTKNSLTS